MTDIQKENKIGGKVPNLRFPSFEGEWEVKKLGEISTFYSGGTPLTSKREYFDGDIPFIRSGEINSDKTEQFISELGLKNSSAKLVEVGDILYALYGATSGEVGICKLNGAINQAVLCIKSNENHYFLFSYLRDKKESITNTFLQGGQGNLSADIVKKIELYIPSIIEQTKISSFLSKIDERIQTQSKIIEQLETLIKNVSEKIFSQNIKFKKIEEKWEVKTLGEILIEINERTINSNQYRILSSTAKGLFYQSDYFNKEVASKDNAGYKILKINQLVFSPQNLWLGNINVNTTYEIGIVSPSYKVFSFNEKAIVGYCKYFLKSSKMMFEYEQCSEQGASIVRRNLNMELFLNIPILLPKLEEQIQISSFLTKIDQKIQTEKAILKQLEMQKKYLLQQMFV